VEEWTILLTRQKETCSVFAKVYFKKVIYGNKDRNHPEGNHFIGKIVAGALPFPV
jgi:hypothetical protein